MLNNGPKNPISLINEFCLRTSSKVEFEFALDNCEYVARVLYEGRVIGEGKDKKKQIAKTKAAEAAVLELNQKPVPKGEVDSAKLEKELASLLIKLGKKGSFKLGFKDPLFVYEYFIAGSLVAEATCVTEPSAKFKCLKKVVNKLTPLVNQQKQKRDQTEANQFVSAPADLEVHDKIAYKNKEFLSALVTSFELSSSDKKQIFEIQEEVYTVCKIHNLNVIPLGSHCLSIIRTCKKQLDFCIVIENLSDTAVFAVAESIEKLKQKSLDPAAQKTCPKFTSALEILNNDCVFYSKSIFIKLSKDAVEANIFFYDLNLHPSLLHYSSLSKNYSKSPQLLTCVVLRHWKHKFALQVPVEMLDLLVFEYTTDKHPLHLAFRIVLELLAGGVYLPGSSRPVKTAHHEYLLSSWPLKSRHQTMAEALKSLISFSQGEIHLILS